ncbi:MAG: selenide, water dikinase SelD [Pseudomonadota bacterium]
MQSSNPLRQDLVFVGGGHSHALALRMLAMNPVPGLRITLISPAPFTPYSGMLPGLIAGHYTFEETHIDLVRLCAWADVRFLKDVVLAMNPAEQTLELAARGRLHYDMVSLDIGSQPELDSVPGARQHSVPVKPVAALWDRWQQLEANPAKGRVAIVGGGAGSVEVALAMAHHLEAGAAELSLYCAADSVLPGYGSGVRRAAERALAARKVSVHTSHRVERVEEGVLAFNSRAQADFDTLIWSTGAAPSPWVASSGLPVDERGFMAVLDTLQSTAFPNVFGAGDIATQLAHPRPKAGVYAVRQGPVLAHNLRALALGEPLKNHRPQKNFLSLLSLGDKKAVAERNGFSAGGAWTWRWKDRIDRAFMDQFSQLTPRAMASTTESAEQAPCGGCGAKIGGDVLSRVLRDLEREFPFALGNRDEDDAVVVPGADPLLQSVDALRALTDDPWRMGRIAAQHALSDLYACGAVPSSCQALITLPFAAASLLERDLRLLMRGALSVLEPARCWLLGGHSMQGPELQVGFVVGGTTASGTPLRKQGANSGDALVLTQAIGAGALFAAHMQLRADGRDVERALTLMETGNGPASATAVESGVSAMTDVTGFGLAGHLFEMLGESLGAQLNLSAIPILAGSEEAMADGIFSTMHEANRAHAGEYVGPCEDGLHIRRELLFDPQTSGGLLMAVPGHIAEQAIEKLRGQGYDGARIGIVKALAGTSGFRITCA